MVMAGVSSNKVRNDPSTVRVTGVYESFDK